MARVGRCIHSVKPQDQRDYFPFHFVDIAPIDYNYYPVGMDFETAFEYIHRVKGLRVFMELNVHDTFASTPTDTTFGFGQQPILRIFSGDETHIRRDFEKNYSWPDWLYPEPSYDPFFGSGSVNLGDPTRVPLQYSAEDSFSPFLLVNASIEGGDEGDRQNIANITTNPPDTVNWSVSSCTGKYMGKEFLIYESSSATGLLPVTGSVVIEGCDYWSYNGVWSTSTGKQLINPVPSGF